MSYRIRYEAGKQHVWKWGAALAGMLICCSGAVFVWQYGSAGEGLYDAMARFVGGMILAAR